MKKELNNWFQARGIPTFRKELECLLNSLNLKSSKELLDKSYGLSLSDQYWFKGINDNIEWENINFFTNNFNYETYCEISITNSRNIKNVSLFSPNNTTDGMLQKAWIIENNERYLIKGAYHRLNTEPINEWLASQIGKCLNLDYCDYELSIYKDKLVSKCRCFINEDEELISASQVLTTDKKSNNENEFNYYIRILEKNGIKDARKKLTDMLVVDYLIGNFDRHLNNFGIIRDVNTLKWKRLAPIFDCGESMCCNANNIYELDLDNTIIKFFSNANKNINYLERFIDFNNYDFNCLKDWILHKSYGINDYMTYQKF